MNTSSRQMFNVFCTTWLLLIAAVVADFASQGTNIPSRLVECDFTYREALDDPEVLRVHYGAAFEPERPGSGSIVVLGHHHTGTSMMTRLMMLMGMFAGNKEDLDILPNNPLKHWEFKNVFQVHQHLLTRLADQRYMFVHAVNVSTDRIDAETKQHFGCFADKVIATLGRHEPWVLKDPRMMHFADLWLHKMHNPVCALVYRDPIVNAQRLYRHFKRHSEKFGKDVMTQEQVQAVWEQGMLRALRACREYPTVIIQFGDLVGDLNAFSQSLKAGLEEVGVTGLHLPAQTDLHQHFQKYMKPKGGMSAVSHPWENMWKLTGSQTALSTALFLVSKMPIAAIAPGSTRASVVLDLYQAMMDTPSLKFQSPSEAFSIQP